MIVTFYGFFFLFLFFFKRIFFFPTTNIQPLARPNHAVADVFFLVYYIG